jgi:hypothetical protein
VLTPIRSVVGAAAPPEETEPRHPIVEANENERSAPTTKIGWRRLAHSAAPYGIYLLFNGTSSTIAMQYPWGLTLVAFFTIVIFIVIS